MKKRNQLIPPLKAIQKVTNVLKLTEKILSENSVTVKYNTFTDPRDGQIYKTVKLKDGKTWMAQNLNFDVGENCWFYDNDSENGKKYGRLYTWEAAKKACPEGWHLPTDDEWQKMVKHYGMVYKEGGSTSHDGYNTLMQGGSSGFSAVLGGYLSSFNYFDSLGEEGYYWSTEYDFSGIFCYGFNSGFDDLWRYNIDMSDALSCRCLQD